MNKKTIIISLVACVAVVALASAWASSYPDGLEWVAEKLGFLGKASEKSLIVTPFADYNMKWLGETFTSTFISGLIGTAAVFILGFFIGRLLKSRHS